MAVPHELSLDEAQEVLAVVTPCLQEPHGEPFEVLQTSLCGRPEPSVEEIARQKSPLTVVQLPSVVHG
jgi:hypothetical protein